MKIFSSGDEDAMQILSERISPGYLTDFRIANYTLPKVVVDIFVIVKKMRQNQSR